MPYLKWGRVQSLSPTFVSTLISVFNSSQATLKKQAGVKQVDKGWLCSCRTQRKKVKSAVRDCMYTDRQNLLPRVTARTHIIGSVCLIPLILQELG